MCPPVHFGDIPRWIAEPPVRLNPDAVVALEVVDEAEEKERRARAERNLELIKENIVVLPGDLQAQLYHWMHNALDLRIYK